VNRTTAAKLLRLARDTGASDEERRTAAMLVCEWLAEAGLLSVTPHAKPNPLASQGSLLRDSTHGKVNAKTRWRIVWSAAQMRALGGGRLDRFMPLHTDDYREALKTFLRIRAELFGEP
jgi:hypothetical protein